jgi:hypothetical protein
LVEAQPYEAAFSGFVVMKIFSRFLLEYWRFVLNFSLSLLVCFLMGFYAVHVNPDFFSESRSFVLMLYVTWSIPFVWIFFIIYGFILYKRRIVERRDQESREKE